MNDPAKSLWQALGSGLLGATVLTVVHETARHLIAEAPRADILGMRAIRKVMDKTDARQPDDDTLHTWALGGDLVANTVYYSLIGLASPRYALLTGTALGLAAGAGAVALPGPMGLGTAPSQRTTATAAMTVGWYLLGGLATAGVYTLLKRR
ncbi:hypothetical protein ACO2Q8_00380 [Larkinella sp. VNQ87]|uniref:hypothetical protein n=1 Tax=Larkinella sp. VNQ87 TaxID=3400921 RepID=UPI003C11F282